MFTIENIARGFVIGLVAYVLIRLIFYAIFKSWHDVQRQVKEEQHEQFQETVKKTERRTDEKDEGTT